MWDAPSHFEAHAKSLSHRLNSKTQLGQDGENCKALSASDFQTVLDGVRKDGGVSINSLGHYNIRKAKWCLAEAQRMIVREFLCGATSMTICMDGWKSFLGIRFTAFNGQTTRFGYVDIIRDRDSVGKPS